MVKLKLFVVLFAVTPLAVLDLSACATEPEVESVVEENSVEAPDALAQADLGLFNRCSLVSW